MTFIDSWDAGGLWDSGLQWDVNVGPNPGDVAPYLALVTSEHSDKPKYISMLTALLQPLADARAVLASMPGLFDLDIAVGDQLDVVGEWVGISRVLTFGISNVYFSFDIAGLGFDQGVWWSIGDPTGYLTILPDDQYRTLLRARIVANQWDGSVPNAYAVWDAEFAGTGYSIKIHDYDNMHMDYELVGPVPDALTKGLFTSGYLNLKPLGVHIDSYIVPT